MIYLDTITGPKGNYNLYAAQETVYYRHDLLGIEFMQPETYRELYVDTEEEEECILLENAYVVYCEINNQGPSLHIAGAHTDLQEAVKLALVNTQLEMVNESSEESYILLRAVLGSEDKRSFIFEIKDHINNVTTFTHVQDYNELTEDLTQLLH